VKDIESETPYTNDNKFFIGDGNQRGPSDGNGGHTDENGANGNNADADLFTARKDYIKAQASRSVGSGGPALEDSEPEYEGVFKTVVLVSLGAKSQGYNGSPNIMELNLQGSDGPGTPLTSGFPLRKTDNYEQKFSRVAYRVNNSNASTGTNAADGNNWTRYIWITHEILTPWYMAGLGWVSATNPLSRWAGLVDPVNGAYEVGYGQVNYLYNPQYSWSNLLP
jgi:hypothetical protein